MFESMENVATTAVADLVELVESGVIDYNVPLADNFPATAYRVVYVNGRPYKLEVELRLKPATF